MWAGLKYIIGRYVIIANIWAYWSPQERIPALNILTQCPHCLVMWFRKLRNHSENWLHPHFFFFLSLKSFCKATLGRWQLSLILRKPLHCCSVISPASPACVFFTLGLVQRCAGGPDPPGDRSTDKKTPCLRRCMSAWGKWHDFRAATGGRGSFRNVCFFGEIGRSVTLGSVFL